jgi:hypothetical protein
MIGATWISMYVCTFFTTAFSSAVSTSASWQQSLFGAGSGFACLASSTAGAVAVAMSLLLLMPD